MWYVAGSSPGEVSLEALRVAHRIVAVAGDRTQHDRHVRCPPKLLNSLAVTDGADGPLTPSEIGERTLVSSGTVIGTLDQLEYRGWVWRAPNPDDRRSVSV